MTELMTTRPAGVHVTVVVPDAELPLGVEARLASFIHRYAALETTTVTVHGSVSGT
jgi:hypothetical protein